MPGMTLGFFTRHRLLFSAIFLLGCLATSVLGSSRAITSEEAAYYERVQKILKGALPVPQAPWELIEEEALGAPFVVKIKAEKKPMYVTYYQVVANRALEEGVERGDVEKLNQAQAGEPERMQKLMDETRPKLEALGQKMQAAATRGDFAEVERLRLELEKLQAPMAQTAQENEEKFNALATLPEGFDGRYQITLSTVLEEGGNVKFQKAPEVAGLPVLWGTHDHVSKVGDSYDGMFFIYLGPVQCVQTSGGLVMKDVRKNKVGRFTASHLTVIVKGAKAHARQIVEAIDWAQLKALVTP